MQVRDLWNDLSKLDPNLRVMVHVDGRYFDILEVAVIDGDNERVVLL